MAPDDQAATSAASTPEILLQLLKRDWPDARAFLKPDRLAILIDRLKALAGASDQADRTEALRQALPLLDPLPTNHAVRAAARQIITDLPDVPPVSELPTDLQLWLANPAGDRPSTAEIITTAQSSLLKAPTFTAAEAGLSSTASTPDLIRLVDPQGEPRFPVFQFEAGTKQPLDVVVRINRMLLADVDPWGVAYWWLTWNHWIGAVPAAEVGRMTDDQLLEAVAVLLGD
ncbi:hypothetical protein [Kitasatospora kifunensis]|uniref:Uncharacterized protein n=1 Tax=Kitasatospora kifunensis TaxID=58351 RepID=A0A7W7W0Y5_KITKI|nr:hypothetical protein [Kitasatospora kifunensis]MBB4929130.1 hypothetical protein [Kitasatospora kifunensis]